jgi:hypothetical protein
MLKLNMELPKARAVKWTGSNQSEITQLQGFLQSVGASFNFTDNEDGTLTVQGGSLNGATINTDDWIGAVPQVRGSIPGIDSTIRPLWTLTLWTSASGTGQYLDSLI